MIDYLNMLNARDGGIGGVKITGEKCETEYNNAKGVECYERSKKKGPTGASVIHPLSTGITYSVLEKATADKIPVISMGYGRTDAADGRVFPYIFPLITTYWSQATSMVKFMGQKSGGMDKLKGKKITLVYHDSAFGKEPIPVLEAQAKKFGFEFSAIPVAHPGNEQGAQWLQVRQIINHHAPTRSPIDHGAVVLVLVLKYSLLMLHHYIAYFNLTKKRHCIGYN